MKHIPATLVAFDNRDDVSKTKSALDRCASLFKFDEVKFVTKEQLSDRYRDGYLGAMRWELEELRHVGTSDKIFFVSDDGFIANPQAWIYEFLNYDMIGAPWPAHWAKGGNIKSKDHRVGNTGFCIRSRRFIEEVAREALLQNPTEPPDVFACQTLGPVLTTRGFNYAPPAIAGLFSFEHPIDEGTANELSFGFHGKVSGRTGESIAEMLLKRTHLSLSHTGESIADWESPVRHSKMGFWRHFFSCVRFGLSSWTRIVKRRVPKMNGAVSSLIGGTILHFSLTPYLSTVGEPLGKWWAEGLHWALYCLATGGLWVFGSLFVDLIRSPSRLHALLQKELAATKANSIRDLSASKEELHMAQIESQSALSEANEAIKERDNQIREITIEFEKKLSEVKDTRIKKIADS